MNLYQKYRPSSFKGLVAQEHVKNTLLNALKKEMLTHAYLFCGPRGTGKTSTARLLAKAINCENLEPKTFEPCNKCKVCQEINNGSLVDLIEIDAASNRGVDEIRDLRESVKFAPSQSKNKVYIIDEVHMLTKEAFNALLKTLEEPPQNVYFILATTELHKIPDTIVSRCQRFGFRRINFEDITNHLEFICKEEKVKSERSTLEKISLRSEGCMRDALSLLDQLISFGEVNDLNLNQILGASQNDSVEGFVENLLQNNVSENLEIINQVHKEGLSLDEFCKSFIDCLQTKMIENLKNQIVLEKITKISKAWMQIYNEFRQTNNLKFGLEILCIEGINANQNSGSNQDSGSSLEPKERVNLNHNTLSETRVLELIKAQTQKLLVAKDQKSEAKVGTDFKAEEKINLDEIKFELNAYIDKQVSLKISNLNLNPSSNNLDTNEKMSSNLKQAIEISNSLQTEEVVDLVNFEPDCNFKISELKRSWKKIVKKAPIPKLTRLLNEAELEKIDENLYLIYSANFFLEQIENPEYIRVVEKLLYEHNYAVRIKTISKKDWVSKSLSTGSKMSSTNVGGSQDARLENIDNSNVQSSNRLKTIEPIIEPLKESRSKPITIESNSPVSDMTEVNDQDFSEEEADFNLEDLFEIE